MSLVEHRAVNVASIPPDEGRILRVGGQLVAVFHLRGGGVRATQPWCPHRGGPLADGLVGDGTLVCPLHGRTFSLDSGAAGAGETGIVTFPARVERDGTVVVSLPPAVALPCRRDVEVVVA
jgi:nitrite reductase (NADH) small subunit